MIKKNTKTLPRFMANWKNICTALGWEQLLRKYGCPRKQLQATHPKLETRRGSQIDVLSATSENRLRSL